MSADHVTRDEAIASARHLYPFPIVVAELHNSEAPAHWVVTLYETNADRKRDLPAARVTVAYWRE